MLISAFTNALLKSQVVFVFVIINALWTNMNNYIFTKIYKY